jgi:hypothetical protein
MLITLELTVANSDSVLSYIEQAGLWSRLYIDDPYYSICLVDCEDGMATWLGLLC